MLRHAAALTLLLALPASAEDVVEPRSGVSFPSTRDDMDLIGAGLRVKSIAFVKVKVYAIALYVSPSARDGVLAQHRGKNRPAALYQDLVWGDFSKEIVLKFTRGLGQGRIQEAMREALEGADKARTDTFIGYFPEVKEGQECVLRWVSPGGGLDVTMAGEKKPRIEDKAFAAAVFGIWLRETPIQDDIKVDLVSRL